MPPKKNEIPNHLRKLASNEAESIRAMFSFYDFEAKGSIYKKHAEILLNQLGIEAATAALPDRVGLREFLLFVDARLPDSEPMLDCSMV